MIEIMTFDAGLIDANVSEIDEFLRKYFRKMSDGTSDNKTLFHIIIKCNDDKFAFGAYWEEADKQQLLDKFVKLIEDLKIEFNL